MSAGGRTYWRSLEEAARAPDAEGEFPDGADRPDGVSRRDFLQWLGAGLALTTAAGCARTPQGKILPYSERPQSVTPGVPQFYATSMLRDGCAVGLVVESHEGRPTKIEGNADHPASLGAAGVYEQASVLELYNPHRARAVRGRDGETTWDVFAAATHARSDRGARLRFVLEPTTSPLIGEALARVRQRYPEARFTFFAPLANTRFDSAVKQLFGRSLSVQYDFSKANSIIALDSDFLMSGPFALRHARQFADGRRLARASDAMNRLYAIEPMLSVTGAAADERLPVRASEILGFAAAIARAIGVKVASSIESTVQQPMVAAIARELRAHAGSSIVIAGERQSIEVHALALAINQALGNFGKTIQFTESVYLDAGDATQDLQTLSTELEHGAVDTLVILDGNPAYSAPAELDFARKLRQVPRSVYWGLYENETARACQWLLPAQHYLESWGDARAFDGTHSIVQPLVAPLYDGVSITTALSHFAGDAPSNDYERLRASFARRALQSERDWEKLLQRGFLDGSAAPFVTPDFNPDALASILDRAAAAKSKAPASHELELNLVPDYSVFDGRFADNPWLLELPRPLTKLTWDNAALMSPRTAARLHLHNDDVIEITTPRARTRLPVLIAPGHADDCLSAALGYGRSGAETWADGVGVNLYPFSTTQSPFYSTVSAQKTSDHYPLSITQQHWQMGDHEQVLAATLAQFRNQPDFTRGQRGPLPSLMHPAERPGDQWAMSIDTSVCIGCGACEVACQAENNILVVGKESVARSREMHWLRIDTYFNGDPQNPTALHQPMLCQHCEHAPCEYVCPVNATVHSPDGLNEMVYNRCVGTRFCSNNCPYKVRRFNFFKWENREPANQGLVQLQRNPEVTVRERGVMEKCSFCVQRIRNNEIKERISNSSITKPIEFQTACQQACPTRAITFGSLTRPGPELARLRRDPRRYDVLHDMGTRPRVEYLAKIRNRDPELG